MKLTIDQSDLLYALEMAAKAVPSKSTLPILEGVLLQAGDGILHITGNNTDIAIQSAVKCHVPEAGEVIVNARLFLDIIRKVPDQEIFIHVEPGNNSLIIETCSTTMKISAYLAEGYPELPNFETQNSFNIDANILRELISGVSFAASEDQNRPTLRGVLIEVGSGIFNAVALDGYKMAIKKAELEAHKESKMLISARRLEMVVKAFRSGKVTISENNTMVLMQDETTKIYLHQIGGDFMNYRAYIPNDFSTVATVKLENLISVLERSMLIFDGGDPKTPKNPMVTTVKVDTIKTFINGISGEIKDSIPADITGEEIKIAFDPRKLLDCIKHIDQESIKISFTSVSGPCTITPVKGEGFFYLILPVRLPKPNGG